MGLPASGYLLLLFGTIASGILGVVVDALLPDIASLAVFFTAYIVNMLIVSRMQHRKECRERLE